MCFKKTIVLICFFISAVSCNKSDKSGNKSGLSAGNETLDEDDKGLFKVWVGNISYDYSGDKVELEIDLLSGSYVSYIYGTSFKVTNGYQYVRCSTDIHLKGTNKKGNLEFNHTSLSYHSSAYSYIQAEKVCEDVANFINYQNSYYGAEYRYEGYYLDLCFNGKCELFLSKY